MTLVLKDLTTFGQVGNTGVQQYVFDPGMIKGIILVPKAWRADSTYINSMLTNLKADTLKAVGSRIFPIFRFGEMKDNSTEDKMIELGYGDEINGPEGKHKFQLEVLGGGVDLQIQLRKFNGAGYNALLVDENDVIMGTSTSTAGEMAGLTCNFRAQKIKFTDGSTNTKYLINVSFADTTELIDNLVIFKSNVSIEQSVKGIINVALSQFKAAIATAVYIKAKTNQGLIDLYDSYGGSGGEMSAAAAWKVKKADGSSASLTVTYDDVDKFWILTFTTLTGQAITVSQVSPAALAALGIGGSPENGFESDVLTITLP